MSRRLSSTRFKDSAVGTKLTGVADAGDGSAAGAAAGAASGFLGLLLFFPIPKRGTAALSTDGRTAGFRWEVVGPENGLTAEH